MSKRELRALRTKERKEAQLTERRLRSGTVRIDKAEMSGKESERNGEGSGQEELEELREQLARTQEQLTKREKELALTENSLEQAQVQAQEAAEQLACCEAQLHTQRLEAEVDKLRGVESLRKEFDLERKQLRADREADTARFNEWRNIFEDDKKKLLQRVSLLERQLKDGEQHGGDGEDTGGTVAVGMSRSGNVHSSSLPAEGRSDPTPKVSLSPLEAVGRAHEGDPSVEEHTHRERESPPASVGGSEHLGGGEATPEAAVDHTHRGESHESHDPSTSTHASTTNSSTGSGATLSTIEGRVDGHRADTTTRVEPSSISTSSTVPAGSVGTSVMDTVAQLLEAQRVMMAAQVQAMAAQSVPPLSKFSGEDINTEEGSIDRWLEQFDERAIAAKWNDEQRLFQLKAHLEKTAEHTVRILPSEERSTYALVVAALRSRFRSLDIEELRGLEFHQLMQDKQTVEELGVQLQKLARKAFPGSGAREFDRMLKGRFYQALLPKWQRKLGAPKTTESFEELYARARTLERHDQQFSAGRGDSRQTKEKSHQVQPSSKEGSAKRPVEQQRGASSPAPIPARTPNRPKMRQKGCYNCGELGHFERNCPRLKSESSGRTGKVSTLTAELQVAAEKLSVSQLEQLLAEKRLSAEQGQLTIDAARVETVTVNTAEAVGPVLQLEVSIEGHPVKAVVDSGAQSTIISRALLHEVGRHMKVEGRGVPQLEQPTVKLYGRSGKNSGELIVTAQANLQLSVGDRSITVPVFIQPESEISCLLGMNVLPYLGVRFLQGDKQLLDAKTPLTSSPKESKVCIIKSTYLPGRKVTFLEAELQPPLQDSDVLVFEPNRNQLVAIGLDAPDALFKQQPGGQVLVPIGNYEAVSARLEPGTCLGAVTCILESDVQENCPEVPKVVSSEPETATPSAHVSTVTGETERLSRLYEALSLEQGTLSSDEFTKLKRLIGTNEDVFAVDQTELGHTDLVQHHVETGDHSPIRQPARRVPFIYRDKIAKMVAEMEELGVVRPSSSPWASPVVLVPKKDGTHRFCVDYRKLNSISKKDVYPLPRIDDILDTLGGTKFFSTLDLAAGYWQIGMDAESATKSAFITPQGLHEFIRMPFGMCNAPATFQRLMEKVLSGLLWKTCFAYIDDVLVCSGTFSEHLDHLQQVFSRLRQAGLRLKAKKCLFLREEVPYLGHVVTKRGIRPDPAKTEKIRKYPVPQDISQTRQFLGLASYYRRFVPDFSRIASPLHSLLKKEAVFCWTTECQRAFAHLKRLLVSAPVLAYPQFQSGHPFIVETDASLKGLGAVLAQQQADDKVHPIAFASRSLSTHECNYSITELETLGLVWAIKLFRPYLLGHHCVVFTDHSACTSLLSSAHPSSKLARWAMAIQELDLDIRHRSGKSNCVADALSRNPVPVARVLQIGAGGPAMTTPGHESDIRKLQRCDEELSPIFRYLEDDVLPADDKQARRLVMEKPNFELIEGVLYYENPAVPGYLRIAVPKSLKQTLLKESHGGKFAGHFAERKIYATLRTKYWWKGMRSDIRHYCRSCLACVSRKGPGRAKRPKLQPIPVGGPFHMVGVDILQLPLSFLGNQYAIVYMDYLTKWPEVFAVADQKAETIARLLVEEVISRHGVPEHLLSDRGANFLSALVEEVCKLVGTTKINTSGYHPQCDGLVEKFNGTLINMLSKSVEKYGRDWDRHLPYLMFAYRVAVQDSTQASPFYLLYGREPQIPTETALSQPRTTYQVEFPDYSTELVANLSDAWALAHQNIEKAQKKQKAQHDKHSSEPYLKVGDRVMVHHPGQVKGKAWKFARPYFGPYEVLSVTPTNVEVRLLNCPQENSIFVSQNRIRRCYDEMTDELWIGHGVSAPKPKKGRSTSKKFDRQPVVSATQEYTGPMTRSRIGKLD